VAGTWAEARTEAETDWLMWLAVLLPAYCTARMAQHHVDLWEWVWSLEPGVRPDPFVGVWFRGGAKSTTAEMACVALGARKKRKYALYVCQTQDQADDHVGNIGAMLESERIELMYPAMADRAVGKYGTSKGWRRNRVRTSSGFVVDALGLDSAARGVKLDAQRPDLLVVDDIDSDHDGPGIVAKKITTLTKAIIPAGADDLAVLAIQNLVHPDSVFSRLVDGRADFLARRTVSGPVPAVADLEVESNPGGGHRIVGGTATWEGMPLERCQETLNDIGLSAFMSECQHDVEPPAGGMFDHLEFARCDLHEVPDLVRTVVWCDPAVTNTDDSDSMGIQADGIDANGTIYRLWSWEERTSPLDALCRALRTALELGAEAVGVETDQGGDTWQSVYREACGVVLAERAYAGRTAPEFRSDKAGSIGPKTHRAQQMLAQGYEKAGRIVHVRGTHTVLERALRRFPKTKPYDLVDAAFWSWHDLTNPAQRRTMRFVA
jgi:hypothetical protein